MSFKFDNRVSPMDIIAIAGSLYVGFKVFFSQGAEIDHLKTAQKYTTKELEKVEMRSNHNDSEILTQLKQQRVEQQRHFDRLDTKLDRLIDRELKSRSQ